MWQGVYKGYWSPVFKIPLSGLIHVNLYYYQKYMPPPIKILGGPIIFTILVV